MTSSPVELLAEAEPVTVSLVFSCSCDSLGSIVMMTPAVSPFESVTEVPLAEAEELHAAKERGSEKSSPVRARLKA
jgi:hypothetical protein